MQLYKLMGRENPKAGKFGVEIEVEGEVRSFKEYLPPKSWRMTEDGSLRNEYNAEYVLKNPLSVEGAKKALVTLDTFFSDHGLVVEPSVRTGVHIHLNVTHLSFKEISKIVLVYLTLERVLTKYAGEDRDGNLFCLRACDCPYFVDAIKVAFESGSWNFDQDTYKYSSLNLATLFKHGSLEFRAIKTTKSPLDLFVWLDIISALETYALALEDRVLIPYEISYYGPDVWAKRVLGDHLFKEVDNTLLESNIKKDMRNIQVLYHTKVVEGVEPFVEQEEEFIFEDEDAPDL